jgi:hypothetical protein
MGISGAEFRLYPVAQADEHRELTLMAPFEDLDSSTLTQQALELAKRVEQLQTPAAYTLRTDGTGTAKAEALHPGAWLLVGKPASLGDMTCYVEPQVILMPQQGENGSDVYDILLQPKATVLPSDTETVQRSVVKVWQDPGFESQRPDAITVRLLRDGVAVDRVKLSEENNWRYTWKDLLPNAKWTVEEEVPEGYVSEVQYDQGVFTLTNHRKTIDQTGHIWWPVALALGAGVLLVLLGVILRRSGRHGA